jgi:uncharacterized cupredoxin-like copper-binding protein
VPTDGLGVRAAPSRLLPNDQVKQGLGYASGRMRSMPSRAPVVVVVAFFAVSLVLVLIGAQRPLERPPDIDIASPGTHDAPRQVTVIMRDYRFDPTPIVLVPGETVRFRIFNAGLVDHEFSLGDATVQAAWALADAAATPPAPLATPPPASVPPRTGGLRLLLASGAESTADYVVPITSELLLLCNLPGHIERGMVGGVELEGVASFDELRRRPTSLRRPFRVSRTHPVVMLGVRPRTVRHGRVASLAPGHLDVRDHRTA